MNPFFEKNKSLLAKEISISLNEFASSAAGQYPWGKDALKRLEKFVIPGKFIRGLLVLLFADKKSSEAIAIGSALELMHSGILIHDDIMDRDELRRGFPTIHEQYKKNSKAKTDSEKLHYGESMASCVGIIAYFTAFGQFAKVKDLQKQAKLISLFSSEMACLGMGQMDDVDTSTNQQRASLNSIMRVYTQKTGRYTFALPMLAGFILSGKDSTQVKNLIFELAKNLGVIFQLQDDILDLFGKSKDTGKSVGGDIRERKITWLYFNALECSKADAKKLKALYAQQRTLNAQEQKWVMQLFKDCDVKTHAQKLIQKNHDQAQKLIKQLPLTKQQSVIFNDLIDYLVTRAK